MSSLEEAYKDVKRNLNIKILKLGYTPSDFEIVDINSSQGRAIFKFEYCGNKIYFVQGERMDASSVSTASDRTKIVEEIHNDWINKTIKIKENELENGKKEYETEIYDDKAYYYLSGIIELDEYIKIVENLNYY